MGRPPIGKQAMSGAERQRRYLDRQGDGLKARIRELEAEQRATKHATKPDKAAAELIATLQAEIARLRAAAETQQQQAQERPRTAADLLARKAQATAAKAAKLAEAKAAMLAAAAAERPDADVPTLLAENDALKAQLKAARNEEVQTYRPNSAAWGGRSIAPARDNTCRPN